MENYQHVKKVLVTSDTVYDLKMALLHAKEVGFDTETFGLDRADDLFSMQFSVDDTAYYVNFLDYKDGTPVLDIDDIVYELTDVFNRSDLIWYIHNAKFDMQKIYRAGLKIHGRIRDTVVWARLVYNVHFVYSLDACLKRIGLEKDDAVSKYISENKCYTMVNVEGKEGKEKLLHFDQVPFDIMFSYGCMDAWGVLKLGQELHQKLVERGTREDLYIREERLVNIAFGMEERGVCIDTEYAQRGKQIEEAKKNETLKELNSVSDRPYKNGPKWLEETFNKYGIPFERNPETDNPVFDKKALGRIEHPVAGLVREFRRADKYISTYYSSFIEQSRKYNGVAHATIRLGGTDTGRFSYTNPNLQNIPKEEEGEYDSYVRKCIRARAGHKLVAIDYRQQEFRLMLDYANEKRLILKILDGADVHQATADEVGCTRKQAKFVNFGLLYGIGVPSLAEMLGMAVKDTQDLKDLYFARLPRVDQLLTNVKAKAQQRKYIDTWAGRRLFYPQREFCYKAPNGLIQGGSADMVRQAMVNVYDRVCGIYDGIHLLIQVHDELLFEVREDRLDLVPTLKNIMQHTYKPFNGMMMDCSIEISDISWGKCDMKELTNGSV